MKRCINCKTLFPINVKSKTCPYCQGKIVSVEEEMSLLKKGHNTGVSRQKKRVLAVDDVGFITSAIKYILESDGCTVDTAGSAEEGLQKLVSGSYDLVVLDINMPGTPVGELVKSLNNKETKIIFCSAVPESEAKLKGLLSQDNVVGYLRKPFEIDTLLATVRSV